MEVYVLKIYFLKENHNFLIKYLVTAEVLQIQIRKNEQTGNRLEYFVHYENCKYILFVLILLF